MPTVLAFDLMDTVVVDPYFTAVPRALGMSLAELSQVQDPEAWIDFELGRIDEATFLARFYQPAAPSSSPAPALVKQAVLASVGYVDGMEALLTELAAGPCRLWAISNYCPWVLDVRRLLGLDRFFEGFVVSCDVGQRKPAPGIYREVLQRSGVDPQACLVVDDRQANVAGAQAVGMLALRFEGTGTLRQQLAARGVL